MDVWRLISLVALLAVVFAQDSATPTPYQTLPPPPDYSDGDFLSPAGATQIYSNGAYLNVSWTTTYRAVNLYFITGGDYANPTTVGVNLADTSTTWHLDVTNFSVPYSFRAVDYYGTDEEQRNGGFYTGQFWITSADDSSSSTIFSIAAAATTASTTITSAESTPPVSSTSNQPSSTVDASSQSSSTSSPAAATSSSSHHGGLSSAAVTGIGVGVGVGVGVFLLLVGALFFWRRYHRRMREKYSGTNQLCSYQPSGRASTGAASSWQQRQADVSAWAAGSNTGASELSGGGYHQPKTPVEAPAMQQDPSELAGDAPHRFAGGEIGHVSPKPEGAPRWG